MVLSDVLSLPASLESDLSRYVRGGGSVLIAAGTSAARRARIPIFGDNILESHYYSRDGERLSHRGRCRSFLSLDGEGRAAGRA